MRPVSFQITQGEEALTSHSGLALIGALMGRTRLASRVDEIILPERPLPDLSHGDVMTSMIGLLALGKPDFEAVGKAVRSLSMTVSPVRPNFCSRKVGRTVRVHGSVVCSLGRRPFQGNKDGSLGQTTRPAHRLAAIDRIRSNSLLHNGNISVCARRPCLAQCIIGASVGNGCQESGSGGRRTPWRRAASSQKETVAVTEIARDAPSRAAFLGDSGQIGLVERIVRQDRKLRRPEQIAQRSA